MLLLKCCIQYASKFGKLSGGHRRGRSVFMLISKDSNAKECSDYCSIALILHSSKVMLQILQGLNSTWTENFQMYKPDLEKAEEPDITLSTSIGSWEKERNSRKTFTSAVLTMLKTLTVWITTNWKIFKKMGILGHFTCLLSNLHAG